MNTGERNIIILLSVIAILALVYFAVMFNPDSRHNWNELYNHNDKEPYSNEVLLELLEGYFPDNEIKILDKKNIAESIKTDSTDTTFKNYVFVGSGMYLDSNDSKTLLEFVGQGNQALIATKRIPEELSKILYKRPCDSLEVISLNEETEDYYEEEYVEEEDDNEWIEEDAEESYEDAEEYEEEEYVDYEEYEEEDDYEDEMEWEPPPSWAGQYSKGVSDTIISMNFTHPVLQRDSAYVYQYVRRNKPKHYYWNYWEAGYDCDSVLMHVELGYFDTIRTNFIKIPYGEGSFYFHANPIVFTNYHLLDKDALEYAGKVFSHLPEGDIYWDEKSKDYRFEWPGRKPQFAETPLKYILSQQSLRWAWYLMLTLVALYVLFRAKRRQRVIPIRALNNNTSLEFIQTIGRLYHQQQNHKNLASKMMYLFDDFVRSRYGIRLKKADEKTIQRLVVKSEISKAQIDNIFTRYKRMNREEEVSESHLNSFYLALEKFYKNCK